VDLLLLSGLALLGSVGALALAAGLLILPGGIRRATVPYLVWYATGTLLGAALLGLLPEAIDELDPRTALAWLLAGILVFFVLERMLVWRHSHDQDPRRRSAAQLILIGDTIHNFGDGVVIAAALAGSTSLGVATAVAVAAHEIPQEVGDFAILLESGYSRTKALLWNTVSSLGTLGGALVAYAASERLAWVMPYAIAVAAASFLYVALADLVPSFQGRRDVLATLAQVSLVAAGVATVALFHL
jgi:zinc and cadmium transporter